MTAQIGDQLCVSENTLAKKHNRQN